jgi:hypothetical protein
VTWWLKARIAEQEEAVIVRQWHINMFGSSESACNRGTAGSGVFYAVHAKAI